MCSYKLNKNKNLAAALLWGVEHWKMLCEKRKRILVGQLPPPRGGRHVLVDTLIMALMSAPITPVLFVRLACGSNSEPEEVSDMLRRVNGPLCDHIPHPVLVNLLEVWVRSGYLPTTLLTAGHLDGMQSELLVRAALAAGFSMANAYWTHLVVGKLAPTIADIRAALHLLLEGPAVALISPGMVAIVGTLLDKYPLLNADDMAGLPRGILRSLIATYAYVAPIPRGPSSRCVDSASVHWTNIWCCQGIPLNTVIARLVDVDCHDVSDDDDWCVSLLSCLQNVRQDALLGELIGLLAMVGLTPHVMMNVFGKFHHDVFSNCSAALTPENVKVMPSDNTATYDGCRVVWLPIVTMNTLLAETLRPHTIGDDYAEGVLGAVAEDLRRRAGHHAERFARAALYAIASTGRARDVPLLNRFYTLLYREGYSAAHLCLTDGSEG